MTSRINCPQKIASDPTWPAEVGIIFSSLEAAGSAHDERRRLCRVPFRFKAALRLFTDLDSAPQRVLYTRDINQRSLGFLTRDRLPLGYGGLVQLPNPADPAQLVAVPCTLLRCREVAPAWFEGAVSFHRDRFEFAALEDLTDP